MDDKIKELLELNTEIEKNKQKNNDIIRKLKKKNSDLDRQIWQIEHKIIKEYLNFFNNKQNKEFVLYEQYPEIKALEICGNNNYLFPLYNYGKLNVQELAEVIKHIYQFKTKEEFQILTMGATNQHCCDSQGQLYFLIGNSKTLHNFYGYQGEYHSSNLFDLLMKSAHNNKPNYIMIETDYTDLNLNNSLDIECLDVNAPEFKDMVIITGGNKICYYKSSSGYYGCFTASKYKQIFSKYPDTSKRPDIRSIFNFGIHQNDLFRYYSQPI